MAREPKKAAGAAPSPAPAADVAALATAGAPSVDPATIADLAAANYAADASEVEAVPIAAKVEGVIPVAVSIDTLLGVIGDSADRAEQIGIRIVGPMQGRRRAGRHFGPKAQVIPAILLGEDELRAIDGDPMLTWSIVEIGVPEAEDEAEQDA